MRCRKADRQFLDLAARQAYRGWGCVEPNPMVGAVIVNDEGRVLGLGHHRRFGGAHAEIEAIESCRRQGNDARGATMYVTLEPCNHFGKTPPCSIAVAVAGIRRVVMAARDPNQVSAGGLEYLQAHGVECEISDSSIHAARVTAPFVKRMRTELPWVIAKWAQSIDGRIAARSGDSKWISSSVTRRGVHRMRGRVDAIMVGAGTVRMDDPLLTVRGVHARRIPARVVVSGREGLDASSRLASTAGEFRTFLVTGRTDLAAGDIGGAQVHCVPEIQSSTSVQVDLREALRKLRRDHGIETVLVEGGARLIGGLIDAELIDELHIHIGPIVLADADAVSAAVGRVAPAISDEVRFELVSARVRTCDDDVRVVYRRRA